MIITLQIISVVVAAIATIVIAVVACQNLCLIKKNNQKEEEHKAQIKDLYQAIVISNLLSGPSSFGFLKQSIDAFNAHYKGKVKIFD